MNSSAAQPRQVASSQSSIVTHPWFPKMIGLWFAALFGLCSLALAPELLERIVTTLGIDRIVPAAAPPLGQTARLLLALGMAGVGEIAGLLIGRRIAAPKRTEPVRRRGLKSQAETDAGEDAPHLRDRDRHPDAPARKPLSASSDLADDRGEPASGIETALRRRALASEAEHEPRPFIEIAPLPGGELDAAVTVTQAATIDPALETAYSPVPAENPGPVEAFDLAPFDAPLADHADAQPAPFAAPAMAPTKTFVTAFMADEPKMPAVSPTEAVLAQAGPGPAEIAAASLEQLGVVQLSERLALALKARRERREQASVAVTVAPPLVAAVEEADLADPVASAPMADACLPEPPVAYDEPEEALVPPAPATTYSPAPFAARPLFAPLTVDDTDDVDDDFPALARSLALPRLGRNGPAAPEATSAPVSPELERGLEILARRAPKPDAPVTDAETLGDAIESEAFPVVDEGEADELTDDILEEGYSSLLAMGVGYHRTEAVRIEEPQSDEIEPVVIFPGQGARTVGEPTRIPLESSANAPFSRPGMTHHEAEPSPPVETANQADPEETGRALRAALASLQRISGAR